MILCYYHLFYSRQDIRLSLNKKLKKKKKSIRFSSIHHHHYYYPKRFNIGWLICTKKFIHLHHHPNRTNVRSIERSSSTFEFEQREKTAKKFSLSPSFLLWIFVILKIEKKEFYNEFIRKKIIEIIISIGIQSKILSNQQQKNQLRHSTFDTKITLIIEFFSLQNSIFLFVHICDLIFFKN